MASLEFKTTLIAVDNDLQQVQQGLKHMVQNSSTTLLKNLIEETRFQVAQIYTEEKTDRERTSIFSTINQTWLRLWEQFKHIPEAIDLLKLCDQRTTQYMAYTRLFYGVALINEAVFSEYEPSLMQKRTSGFIQLAEVVDVYKSYLYPSDLETIYQFAQNAIVVSSRNVKDYWGTDLERSYLTTQVRGACYLIISSIEQEQTPLHSTALRLNSPQTTQDSSEEQSVQPWWEDIVGVFADDPTYDESMQLGRQYRMFNHDASTESSEV